MKKKLSIIMITFMVMMVMLLTINYAAELKKVTNEKTIQAEVETIEAEDNVSNTSTTENDLRNSEDNTATTDENKGGVNGLGLVAVALATGLACIGSGIAVAVVGSSAVGAISENPSLLGKTIIFAGLAEGIAIYGLIISIMILNKI